MFTSKVIVI